MTTIPKSFRFHHLRARKSVLNEDTQERTLQITNNGGATIAFNHDGNKLFAAVAFCSPYDNFDRRMGRIKAAGQLVSLMGDPSKALGNSRRFKIVTNVESHEEITEAVKDIIDEVSFSEDL